MDKIICIGKNYLDHAKELGDSVPAMPVIFFKPPSVLCQAKRGETLSIELPKERGSVHHECEIVLRIKMDGSRIFFDAATLGLDMTLRDTQSEIKKNGHPWELAKVFPNSAIIGPWLQLDEFPEYLDEEFSLKIGTEIRQKGHGNEMRVNPQDCLSHIQKNFPILNGDLLFTGTPAGVGAVHPGNLAELRWSGETLFRVLWT